jgi:arsenate reductase (thioredoxin)
MSGKPTVLFLCTGNSCRSQMAEGLLRAEADDRFTAASAGTEPADRVHPLAIRVMNEIGVDISAARAKNVSEYLGRLHAAHLVIVCDGANRSCPTVFPGVLTRTFWPIEDPAAFQGTPEATLTKFREIRDQIRERISQWLAKTPAA